MASCEGQVVGELAPAKAPSSAAGALPLRLGAAFFWIATVFYGGWLIWRTFLPLEIDYDEAWNAWHAQALVGGRPLYPPREALITNNYPPLSFLVLALGAKLTGADLIVLGRLASLLGVGASAAAAAAIVRLLGGSRAAAWLGAGWYLATMARSCPGYVGMNDPTLLALGVMAWALVLFVQRYRSGRSTDLAILLMVVAGFVKHSLLATPATVLVWLWFEGEPRKAARAAVVGALGAAAGLALCAWAFGWAFVQQVFMFKRHFSFQPVWEGRQLAMIGIAMLCGLLSTWRRRSQEARFVFTFIVAGLVVFALGRAGDGVDINALFKLILATAIGLAWALDKLPSSWIARSAGPQSVGWAVLGVMAVIMLHAPTQRPYLFWTSPAFHRATDLQVQAAEAEIARVRALPGRVYCPTMSVCFRAGKDFAYDRFAMSERVLTGFWSSAELERRVAAAGFRTERGTSIGAWN